MTTGKVYDYLIIAQSWQDARDWAESRNIDTNRWFWADVNRSIGQGPGSGHFMSGWCDKVVATEAASKHENLPKTQNAAKYYQIDNTKPVRGLDFLWGKNR